MTLLVLLLALMPLVGGGRLAFPDEGLYVAQATNLAGGSWWSDRVGLELDPDGARSAFIGSVVDGTTEAPYVRHPLYPVVLVPFVHAAGVAGAQLLSLLAVWVAAMAGAGIAGRLRQGSAVPTLWLLGLGSPLLFDAFLAIGHALAAALAGLMALGVLCAVPDLCPGTHDRGNGRRRWAAVGSLAAAAVLVGVRSEGVLVVGALGAALAVAAIRRPGASRTTGRWSVDTARLSMGAALLAVGASSFVAELAIVERLARDLAANSAQIDRRPAPLSGAWVTLLQPWRGGLAEMRAAMVLVLLCAALAPLLLRLLPRRPLVPALLLCIAAGAALVHQLAPVTLVSGLMAVFPALLVGLLSLRRSDLRPAAVRVLLGAAAIASTAIVVTAYGEGGGSEWGGRYFHTLLPLVVPVAVIGLLGARDRLPTVERRIATTAVIVLTVSLSVLGLRVGATARNVSDRLVTTTEAFVQDMDRRPPPPVVVATLQATGVSRFFWRQVLDGKDVISPGQLATVHTVLRDADRAGVRSFVLVTDLGRSWMNMLLGTTMAKTGWEVRATTPVRGTPYFVHLFSADAPG